MTAYKSENAPVAIEFKGVSKAYASTDVQALDQVSFKIYEGEFIAIVGASGSGKTTLLKMMNGLVKKDQGEIEYFGEILDKLDPILLRRKMGYVVQEIGLFSHMTIEENIAVVPKLLNWDKEKIAKRVDDLLDLVHLDKNKYRKAYPKELSGGQQQRVGVARALAADPKVCLMDEPFGAVDAMTRQDLQMSLLKIHQGLGKKTFILITHDINEALLLGDRVMVVDQGKILQFAPGREIVHHPADEKVEGLLQVLKIQWKQWKEFYEPIPEK